MPNRPSPPQGSVFLDWYKTGDEVYYYRTGTYSALEHESSGEFCFADLSDYLQGNGALGRFKALGAAELDMPLAPRHPPKLSK